MSRTRELLEKKKNGGSAAVAALPTTSRTQQLLAKKGITATPVTSVAQDLTAATAPKTTPATTATTLESNLDELLSQRTHVQNEKESWRNKANWLVGGGAGKEVALVSQAAIDEAWERYNMYDQWEKELDEQIAQSHAAPGALEQAKAEGAHLLDAGAREQKKTAVRTKAQADADRLASYTSAAPGSDLQNMALLLAGAKGRETAEKRAKELDFVGERLEDTYTADGFWGGHIGQFEANNDLGRINQESGEAWDDYLLNPTEENRERAFMYAALAEKVAGNAEDALNYNSKAKWLTQSVAGYLPQWWDQTKAQVEGGVAGAVAGSLGGAGGMITGARLGATAASSRESYHNMRGQAFRDLVMMGVDEVTAREAANDEAFLSALIEGAETYISFGALGFDELVSMFTGAAKKAGAKGLTTKLLSKLPAKWQPVAKVGMGAVKNAATEYAEEFAQQGVSIANQRRMEANGETGMLDLAGETAKVFGGAVTGRDAEALGQMHEAGTQGAILGAFGAGTSQVVNQAAAAVASHARAKLDPLAQAMIGKNEQNDSTPTNDSGDIAAELVNAGATEVEAEKLAPILTAVLTGEEISGNQAGAIARNSAAISVLESATGEAINTDAPLGEVKTTIRGLASRHSARAEKTATEDTPAQVRPVEATQAPVESPVMESPAVEDFTRRNARAVADFAKTVDKAGATILTQMYTEGQDTEQYIAGMMKAYHAGVTGGSLDSTRLTAGKTGVTSQQAEAAYMAGQADAKAGDTDGTVVQVAEDAGVDWNDDYVKGVDQEVAKRIDRLGKDLGVRVRFVDVVRPVKGKNGIVGTADGQYEGNEILVEKNNPNPELFIAGHEFAHRMKDLAPETYNSFVQAVLADKAYFARGGTGTVEGAITAKIAQYKLKGEALTRETAIDELVADYAGHLLTNEMYLDSFMESHKENRTMLEKLRDLFHEFSLTIKGALGDKAAIAEKKLTKLLENSKQSAQAVRDGKVQKNTATEGGGVRYDLRVFSDGVRFVNVQTDQAQFDGLSDKEKTKRAIQIIKQRFAGKIIGIDNPVFVNGRKAAEYGHPVKNIDSDIRDAKMRAATELDNLMDAGTNFRTEPDGADGHVHPDAVDDFQYYDVIFKVGNEYYKGVINIEIVAKGRLLKDITKIENITQDISSSYGKNPKSTFLRDTSVNSIRKDSEKSNTQNSESKKSLKTDIDLADEINAIYQRGHAEGWTEEEMRDEVDLLVEQRLQEARDKYGVIPAGENPARDIQVPKRTADNQKVSQTVRTILEAKATPDVAIPTIEELTATGDFSYEVYTDKQAMADAENTIRDKGYNTAVMDWTKSVQEGEVSKSNTALGWALYNQAANAGDLKTAMSILTNMVGHQRNAAQAVQATRILKKMSPEAQMYGVQRSAQNLAEELEKRYGKDAPDIRVNEELARKYLEAETDKEREEAMRNLYRDLGRQMPSRFIDKWNAWRYLAMLGNPRTHVRNVLGNAFFAPVVLAKDMTALAIEEAVYRVSGGKLERTKGAVGFGKQGRELLSAAWSDYESVADQVSSGGKYSDLDHSNQYIQEGRRIFKNRVLEAARKGNSAALEAEDMWFSRPHYAYGLAQYCKAHGITAEQMKNGKGLDRARAYAIKEAQKATYRDTNAFSQTISELGRYRGNNKVKKGVGVALEGILPFRKTPANILVRGLEYSPAGFLKGLFWDVWQIKSGKKTAAEVIDHISAGLTGSGLLALGAFLAAQGLVRGAGGDDEEKKEFEELQGHQTYAMELPGGTSVTLDWLAPEALPFFVGVNLWEQKAGNKDGGVTLSDILTATANVTEPLLELSCLQSLNDVFDAVGYAASDGLPALPSALASAATSYLTQGFPTILGQAERTGEDKRMSTYTEKNAFLTPDIQYTIGRISARLPGVDYQQIPYIDAWGRTENAGTGVERAGNNFLNPAYTSTVETSPMEDELLRLYEQTGEGSVLPSRAAKYFNVDGERKDLTAQEYVKYATAKGQTAYKVLTALTGSQAYREMSDAEKAEAVGLVYDYANATAKTKVSAYKPEGWIAKAVKTEKAAGVKAEQYVTLYLAQKDIESLKEADGDTIANSKSLLVMEMVYDVKGLADAQRLALFEDFGVGKSVIHYNKTLVQVKLNEMRRKAG